ncbi:hypothetical protein EG329_007642 [Mollisiaceae sp. DMI_Dod_QoI]|nr:hypothetical protein EG329_007642 [Helotiales sp. DMI_Dod_QoI]
MDAKTLERLYAKDILSHACRAQNDNLYCGSNYRALGTFLNASALAPRTLPAVPGFIHINRRIISDDEDNVKDLNTVDEFRATQGGQCESKETAQVIFVRGFSSPDWICALGAGLRIDPEFFRRHLHFLEKKDYYDLPATRSSSSNLIRIRITSIFLRQVPISQTHIKSLRRDEALRLKKHQRAANRIGQSIVRRFSIHNEQIYTLEQDIAITCKRNQGGWTALVWSDIGHSSNGNGPWSRSSHGTPDECIPTLRHSSKIALLGHESTSKTTNLRPNPDNNQQSASLLALHHGPHKEMRLSRSSPFFALSGLFLFAVSAENQFLNMVQACIDECVQKQSLNQRISSETLDYEKRLLNDHIKHARDLIQIIEAWGDSSWPRAPESLPQADHDQADAMRKGLIADFTFLLQKAEYMVGQCSEGVAYIANAAMLQESRNATEQAHSVHRLTLAAFFFLPLSLTTLLFGMNFVEFGAGTLKIWIFFVVMVPILVLSVVICFWDRIGSWAARFRVRRNGRKYDSEFSLP